MRIVLLLDTTNFAGTERHILVLAAALNAPEYSGKCAVAIACPPGSPVWKAARETCIATLSTPARNSPLPDARTLRLLRRHLVSNRFDILHAHNGSTALHAVLATTLARRGRVVMTQHFLEPAHISHSGIKSKIFDRAHRFVNERIAHFIAVSRAAKEHMIAREDASPQRISVVPNAIADIEILKLSPLESTRAALNCDASTPLVVCAARLEAEKKLEVLIEAIAILKARGVKLKCVIAGEGAQRHALETLIEKLGITDRVQLLGFRDDVLSLIHAADIFALPSRAEPFGLVLLEAMALRKPVVAVDAGGPREIVMDGATGVLAPPDNAAAFADALQLLASDEALRAKFGTAGRARYEKNFQPDAMARATLEVYHRALDEN